MDTDGEVNTREKKAARLAEDILTLSRSTLMLNFRFLDRAFSRLTLQVTETPWFACDGQSLYFEPWYVLGQYKAEQTVINRDLLHTVLHCVLRHAFVGKSIDRERWDFACDVAVEHILNGLESPCLGARRVSKQIPVIETLRADIKNLTAEHIYKWLGAKKITPEEIWELRLGFLADEHGLWYGYRADPNAKNKDVDVEKLWSEVSKRMQTELETLLEDKDSPLVQSLRSLNRAKYDYTAFLRRFGVHGEQMRLSEEEFDINYYSYGMEHYGNIPLIEPLEYRDERRIRDFVIAIDTSGSVRGDVVQSFIQHTHDILLRQESFHERLCLHIIQCDDRIREDAVITSQEDFKKYISELEIKGLGKTDFRPVFNHVAGLRGKGELKELRGLIYFTDGKGIFPEKMPDYDTAFILHCDDCEEPYIPVWAMKLRLSEEDILDKRFSDQ